MTQTAILIVSAEKAFRSLIRQTLTEGEGFATEFCNDALEGLSIISIRHEVALVEYDMSEMNGLEFLQQIRVGRSAGRRDLSVGIVAGFADHQVLSAAIALDLNTMLIRPVSSKDISRRVTKMMTDSLKLKSPEDYFKVQPPLGEMQRALAASKERSAASVLRPIQSPVLRSEPLGPTLRDKPIEDDDQKFGPMRRRPIKDMQVGWQVSRDVIGPTGTRLVGADTIITQRLLSRLLELEEQGAITEAWVRAPLPQPK